MIRLLLSKFLNRLRKYRHRKKVYAAIRNGLKLGKNVTIMDGVRFDSPHNSLISIGNNTTIVGKAKVYGEVSIGNNVVIASGCTILTQNHDISLNHNALPYGTNYINKKVIIKDNVWVGMNVSITPGVVIEEGAVIGLGSVVTRNVEKCSIVGGNPAKKIGMRDIAHYDFLKNKGYYLNDIRGKKYFKNKKRKKFFKEIEVKLISEKKVYDYEIFSEAFKVRAVLYEYYLEHPEISFKYDDQGFYLEYL